jgi:hypothetical protein
MRNFKKNYFFKNLFIICHNYKKYLFKLLNKLIIKYLTFFNLIYLLILLY